MKRTLAAPLAAATLLVAALTGCSTGPTDAAADAADPTTTTSVDPDAFPVTIYHNPECGTSRNALAMIEAAGYAPEVVDYRQLGWTRPLLERLLTEMGASPRDVLREKGTPAACAAAWKMRASGLAISSSPETTTSRKCCRIGIVGRNWVQNRLPKLVMAYNGTPRSCSASTSSRLPGTGPGIESLKRAA